MSTKPQNEIAVRFGKDHNGCTIVVFYEAHGSLVADVEKASLPAKASGRDAIKLTGKIGQLVKSLKLGRHSFTTKSGTYYSYTPA